MYTYKIYIYIYIYIYRIDRELSTRQMNNTACKSRDINPFARGNVQILMFLLFVHIHAKFKGIAAIGTISIVSKMI